MSKPQIMSDDYADLLEDLDYMSGNSLRAKKAAIAIRAQAEHIAALESMVAWRPIETAPKDGTHIDLWAGEERVADCRWNVRSKRWEYWAWGDFDGMAMVKVDYNPTHWMPIPAAPLKEDDGQRTAHS